jgi:hypothetical protein
MSAPSVSITHPTDAKTPALCAGLLGRDEVIDMTAELGDIAGNDTVIGVPHDAKPVTRILQCIRLVSDTLPALWFILLGR